MRIEELKKFLVIMLIVIIIIIIIIEGAPGKNVLTNILGVFFSILYSKVADFLHVSEHYKENMSCEFDHCTMTEFIEPTQKQY